MNDKQIDELFDKVSESAYPVNIQGNADDGGIFRIYTPGLSKREWFAGIAMQGMLMASGRDTSKQDVAELSVAMADELIKQLNKK